MEKLNGMQKEFQILNPLLINMSGKESNIRQIEMIGKLLRKIIQKLLLIFCILKKKRKKFLQLISQKLIGIVKNK